MKAIGGVSALGTASLAGCVGEDSDDVLIGNTTALTGAMSSYGPYIRDGLEYAAQQINDEGGVLGRELRILTEDNESDPETAATTALRQMDEGAVAVTGPVLSDVSIRVRHETEAQQVPFLPIQGASPRLLDKDTRYTFRVGALPAPYYARATGEFVEHIGADNYGAIVADYSYGHSYQEGIEEFVKPIGGLNTQVELAPAGADDFSSQLRAMPDDIEYMDLGGHPVGIFTIIPQMWEVGLDPDATSGPGDPLPIFYDALGDDVDRGITQIHMVDPTTDEYVDVAQQYYEETDEFFDPFTTFGYVTAQLVAEAIEDAGEADPQAVRDAISDIRFDSLLAYPLEYNEWGELTDSKLQVLEFNLDSPPYYPDGDFYVESLFETNTFEPLDPDEWE